MDLMMIIIWLVIGAIAGWLAGLIVQGRGFGLVGDMIVGILGAVVAGFLGIFWGGGYVPAIIGSVVGAVILLGLARLVKRA